MTVHLNLSDYLQLFRAHLQRECTPYSFQGLFYCLARWQDHAACCRAEGVPDLCLDFCRPSKQALSMDNKYLPCLDHLDKMGGCFRQYDAEHVVWVKV